MKHTYFRQWLNKLSMLRKKQAETLLPAILFDNNYYYLKPDF